MALVKHPTAPDWASSDGYGYGYGYGSSYGDGYGYGYGKQDII